MFRPLTLLLCFYVAACNATLYLMGDSTMAPSGDGAGTGTDGWGQYLAKYFTIPIVNKAHAGTSARSFTELGDFNATFALVESGDWAVIEFGHNDGTSSPDNGRSDCVGPDYATTCVVQNSSGQNLTIHTFNYYIQNAITTLAAKGVNTIVSSHTPDDIWPFGTPDRFVGYASLAASNTGQTYVDHYDYVVQAYEALGETEVNTFYPIDHTHTSPTGAQVVADAFVKGLVCGNSALKSDLTSAAQSIANACL